MEHYESKLDSRLGRIKSIADGSCFFHSILMAYSNGYAKSTEQQRIEKVGRIRQNFAQQLSKDTWMDICDGEPSKNSFFISLRNVIDKIYDHLEGKVNSLDSTIKSVISKDEKTEKLNKFIFDKIGKDNMDNKLISDALKISAGGDVYFCSTNFIKVVKKFLKKTYIKRLNESDQEKFERVLSNLNSTLTTITQYAINDAFTIYRNKIGDPNVWMDFEYIPFLADTFDFNVYFIDGKTGMPYITGCDDKLYDSERKNVILLWENGCHFDTLGVIHPDGKTQTTFDSDDELIVKLHTYVSDTKRALKEYECFRNDEESEESEE